MFQRHGKTIATTLAVPCLFFTLITGFLVFHIWNQYAWSFERRVENRAGQRVWVSPIYHGERSSGPLAHYPSRWPSYSGRASC